MNNLIYNNLIKKIMALSIASILVLMPISGFARDIKLQISNEIATVDGVKMQIDKNNGNIKPIIKNGRTLVPMRFIAQSLGASVKWYAPEQKITITSGSDIIEMVVGSNIMQKNGDDIDVEVPPEIIDGRTFVPIRTILEALGGNIEWDSYTQTVTISYSKIGNEDIQEIAEEDIQEPNNDTIELKTISILSDKVEILIPASFEIMSEEIAKLKYSNENGPTLIYTNDTASVNIAFNHTDSRVSDDPNSPFTLEIYKDYLKKTFESGQPSATWYDNKIIDINGKKVVVFELLTPVIDTKIYNLVFFTSVDNHLFIGTFNCIENEMDAWKPIAQTILNSLRVK